MIRRIAILLLLIVVRAATADAADPSTLWKIIHDKCVPNEQQKHDPAPCAAVDLRGGTVVLKDLVGKTQFLLMPTARISGIDDAAILAPHAPNYFHAAWQARRFVEQRAGRALPRDALSLAINSQYGRSQDQLHIHVDCVRSDVRAALAAHLAAIGPHWADLPVPLAGKHYRAMRLMGVDLTANPFRILHQTVPQTAMGNHTLDVIGAVFDGKPGFVVLDDTVNIGAGDFGAGEALQDHDCALAQ